MDFGSMGGGIGGIIGGLIGGSVASGDFANARDAADRSIQELLNMGMPPETAQALVLQQFSSAGQLTPELEQHISAGPAQTITEDPEARNRQMTALNLLSQRASGGLNPEDRQKLNEIRTQAAREQNAKQQQIIQNYQMRGMGGSGAELAAAIAAEQSGANQASQQGDQVAAMASQNALQAALQSGQLGGSIRAQDVQTAGQNANIMNEMNRFQTNLDVGQQQRNVGARNLAQKDNLTNQQGIQNANVQQANTETKRQNTAKVDDWRNKLDLAKTKSGAYGQQSKEFQGRGQKTTDQYGQIGAGLGMAAGMLMNQGGVVPGIAKVSGDHPVNDTVAANLSPGEIVLPKSVLESHDPGDVAKKFVDYVMALNKKPSSEK